MKTSLNISYFSTNKNTKSLSLELNCGSMIESIEQWAKGCIEQVTLSRLKY